MVYAGALFAYSNLVFDMEALFSSILVFFTFQLACFINDYFDYPEDIKNPRKKYPLARGKLTQNDVKRGSYALTLLFGVMLAIGGFLGWFSIFQFIIFAIMLFLAISYTAPPFCFKNRYLDLLVNTLSPAISMVLGWSLVGPLIGIELMWIPVLVLLFGLAQLLNDMVDFEKDKSTFAKLIGWNTTAVLAFSFLFISYGIASWTMIQVEDSSLPYILYSELLILFAGFILMFLAVFDTVKRKDWDKVREKFWSGAPVVGVSLFLYLYL